LKILRKALVTIGAIVLALHFIVAAGFLYFAKNAPAVTRVVPTELRDLSTSPASGQRVFYSGYELEVPWSDRDESKTELDDRPPMHSVWICFRSGLKLFVAARPREAESPDYEALRRVYEVTPDKIHYWTLFQGKDYREMLLLQAKSGFLLGVGDPRTGSNPAETGIFNIQSKGWKGFQYGDPKKRPDEIRLRLYSDRSQVDIMLLQGGYYESAGVTQPEINFIVQSLRNSVEKFDHANGT